MPHFSYSLDSIIDGWYWYLVRGRHSTASIAETTRPPNEWRMVKPALMTYSIRAFISSCTLTMVVLRTAHWPAENESTKTSTLQYHTQDRLVSFLMLLLLPQLNMTVRSEKGPGRPNWWLSALFTSYTHYVSHAPFFELAFLDHNSTQQHHRSSQPAMAMSNNTYYLQSALPSAIRRGVVVV